MIAVNIEEGYRHGDSMRASDTSRAGGHLTTGQLLAFGFPAMTHALIASPVYAILPTFYAANTAVTLAAIGTIAAFSRIIDALNDPVMGYLSDQTRSRFGSRKPWIAAAVVFCAAAVFQLFSPPSTATWVYFLIWSQVLYTGFTMFEVPRSAWGVEITRRWIAAYPGSRPLGLYLVGRIEPPAWRHEWPALRHAVRIGGEVVIEDRAWHGREAELDHLVDLGLVDDDEHEAALDRLAGPEPTTGRRYEALARD